MCHPPMSCFYLPDGCPEKEQARWVEIESMTGPDTSGAKAQILSVQGAGLKACSTQRRIGCIEVMRGCRYSTLWRIGCTEVMRSGAQPKSGGRNKNRLDLESGFAACRSTNW